MKPTEFVYSSHDRCEYIHRWWIVERALEDWHNKTILYLPISSGAKGDQEYSWGTFSPYFDRFRQWGLEPRVFFWSDDLRREDVEVFFDWLRSSQVVVLGGGRTSTGMERYRALGARFFDNPDAFEQTLRARREEGRYNVGFSAGADQLCQFSCDAGGEPQPLFGMVRDVIVRLHYEPAAAGDIEAIARRFPGCLVFGLPNDSGVASTQGRTWHGNEWQLLQVVTDDTWDKPEDQYHIRTRQGVKVEHRYADGRRWQFNGGDVVLRVFYKDGGWEAWIKRPEMPTFHAYGTQDLTHYASVEHILSER